MMPFAYDECPENEHHDFWLSFVDRDFQHPTGFLLKIPLLPPTQVQGIEKLREGRWCMSRNF